MADPLTRLGISRRPAYELFGTPDTSKFGWSDATRQAVAEDQAMADEAMAAEEERAALEDRRIAREREREAEGLADQITRMRNPSAREKFFDQNEAALTGSRRYNQLAEIRRRAPSYADNVLANNLASKMEDPDDRVMFLESVARGEGTFAAKDRVDRSRIRRQQAARLAEAGYSPDEGEEILAKGIDDARVNYAIAQWKNTSSTGGGDDTRMKDLKGLVDLLREQKEAEEFEGGKATDETLADYTRAKTELKKAYESRAFPPAAGMQITPEMEVNARKNAASLDANGRLAAIQEAKNPQQVEFLRRLFAEVPPPVIPPPVIPDDGTNGLTATISDPNTSEVDRNVAFTKLKTLLESQTPPKGATFTEIAKFKNDLKDRIDSARVDLEAVRFSEETAPVWTKEKDIVAKAIKRMAQDLGVEEDTVIASIFPREKSGKPAEQQKLPMSIVPKEMQPRKRDKFGDREMYVKDLIAAYIADQRGEDPADASYQKIAKAKIEELSGWMEEAEKGDYPDKEIYKKAIRKAGLDADRTQEDVIREYIKSVTPAVQEVAPVKAPSGREIKIGKPERTP